jgi:2'-5' RNA ligase
VISVGSVERDALRLFYGLSLPPAATEALAVWGEQTLGKISGVRVIPPEHVHVTLAFLGRRPAGELPALCDALRAAADGVERPVFAPARYRETERVAMLVLEDEGGRAALLQARLSELLEQLGAYRPERQPWLAHVTVARFRARPRLRPELPALGRVSPSEAALYHSLLRPGGAQYEIVEAVALSNG